MTAVHPLPACHDAPLSLYMLSTLLHSLRHAPAEMQAGADEAISISFGWQELESLRQREAALSRMPQLHTHR